MSLFSSLSLSFALLCAVVSLQPLAAQNGQAQPASGQGSSPLVGTWLTVNPQGDGSKSFIFEQYGADGSYRSTSIVRGGPTPGNRLQTWGHYTATPQGKNTYRVGIKFAGWAPLRVCAQGGGCQQLPGYHDVDSVRAFRDQSHLAMNGSNLVSERVQQIPAELTSQLPENKVLAGAPSSGGTSTGGGSPVVIGNPGGSTYHVPGQGGTCDNLQQQRVCSINDGYLYTGRDGCQHCSK